jgi:hypothetical protein
MQIVGGQQLVERQLHAGLVFFDELSNHDGSSTRWANRSTPG